MKKPLVLNLILNFWLLLSLPIMESLALTATPHKKGKLLKTRKVLKKRNPDIYLTPPEISNHFQEPYKLYNETQLTTYHHHHHHHGYHQG